MHTQITQPKTYTEIGKSKKSFLLTTFHYNESDNDDMT